jgi:hypothetical protein
MSTREKIKHYMDVLPDESVNAIDEYINTFIVVSVPQQKSELDPEKGYQILQKFRGSIDRSIDYKKERLEYLDEKYGRID